MPKLSELIPTCIGSVEAGDVTCDGDPSATTAQERAPCSWRDRCRGFQLHLKANGETASQRIRIVNLTGQVKRSAGVDQTAQPVGMTLAQFTRFCRGSLERYAPPSPPAAARQAPAAPKDAAVGSVGARPHAGGSARRTASERARVMKARRLHFHSKRARFLARLDIELADHRIQRRASALLLPGQLHTKTEWLEHRFTLYARHKSGRDVGIARLVYSPTHGINLYIGTSKRHLAAVVSRATLVKLAPKSTTLSNFPVMIQGASDEVMSLVAESIGRLVESGIIKLSGVQRRHGSGARRGS